MPVMREENLMGVSKEEMNYRRTGNFLKSLLVLASRDPRVQFTLPTIKEFILSEVVNGTIDYFGGEGGKVIYQDHIIHVGRSRDFEDLLWEELKEKIGGSPGGGLDDATILYLNELCKPSHHSKGPYTDARTSTELYDYFRSPGYGICQVSGRSSFALPHTLVTNVTERVLSSLSETQRRDVEGIGKEMTKYVESDLRFISEKYHW